MKSLPHEKAAFLGVLAARIVPEFSDLDAAGASRFYTIIDDALQDRPPTMRRQFGVFLSVMRWAPIVRYAAPFHRLAPARQDAVLRWFEDAPIALLRKGTWGLKSMVFMGYYGQPETNALVGYQPAFDGRDGLRA
jgi:hypothetical protein